MSTETIHCLIYRYNRIKERLRAVKLKDSQYIPLDEMEYKTDCDFFLSSKFSEFLESKSNSFDLCIINQREEQGEEFLKLFQIYYNCLDDISTIWTEDKIREALLCLNLKKSLQVGNISIDGKDGRLDFAWIFTGRKTGELASDAIEDDIEVTDDALDETEVSMKKSDIVLESKNQVESESSKQKSKLSLAMDEIIAETYKT